MNYQRISTSSYKDFETKLFEIVLKTQFVNTIIYTTYK